MRRVSLRPPARSEPSILCEPCQHSLCSFRSGKVATVVDFVVWAAARARRFDVKKVRAEFAAAEREKRRQLEEHVRECRRLGIEP